MSATFELPIQGPVGDLPIMNSAGQQLQHTFITQRSPEFQSSSSPQWYRTRKNSSPPRHTARDPRARRSPPYHGEDDEGIAARMAKPRMRLSPHALPKSLLPATERRLLDTHASGMRLKKDSEGERGDLTPDGGSAGREGRQFTVANVGNHGRIYLRPSVRPAHQRYPQPQFTFPMAPPSTAGSEMLNAENKEAVGELDVSPLRGSQWTPTLIPSTPTTARRAFLPDGKRPGHRRAISDSTIPDTSVARESDVGGFKIVITHPGDEQRPRTVEDIDPSTGILLDIAIPSWKLGKPRFTSRGTPLIRGSSYAPTEDIPTSHRSVMIQTPSNMTPRPASLASQVPFPIDRPRVPHASANANAISPASPQLMIPLRATYLSTHLVITPAMFDPLTFKPACDDRTIVRYSSATNAVTAATPPRLVAEITSPSFLDYELLSDFFLTYRSFLEPSDLLRMLVARLRWALARDDEIGMVVRVRTFVALRHWILNYFMDDYVIDYSLRVTFCNLLNDFVEELSQDPRGLKVQLKILSELKKCWRRVCAQYWDGPDFDASLNPNHPIAPGGIAGHRNPGLDPSFWEQVEDGPPRLDEVIAQIKSSQEQASFYADVSRAGHLDSIVLDARPITPEDRSILEERYERDATSPTSVTSLEVISCSFPTKSRTLAQPANPLTAHPVESAPLPGTSGPVATIPRALTGKRVRPSQHKRNVSLTDSLRNHPIMMDKQLFKDHDFLMSIPYAGSLVRGAGLPPGQPFVEVMPPSLAGGESRQTSLLQAPVLEAGKGKPSASAMSGQGMRKLLGSVRRALSSKAPGTSPTQANFTNVTPIGPRGVTTNRPPGTAVVPQTSERPNGARPPVRLDLLGAEVAEDFKKAVREDAALEAAMTNYNLLMPATVSDADDNEEPAYSAECMTPSLELLGQMESRPFSDMGLTTGSKSIVIVDDTLQPLGVPTMAGALPAVNSSVEAFADALLPYQKDPTSPSTPPAHPTGTPRRSSFILSQHVIRPSISAESFPPFTPDIAPVTQVAEGRPSLETIHLSHDFTRPPIAYAQQSPDRPPLSAFRGHTRHRSSRSYLSNQSFGRRRFASLTSAVVPSTIRSFDATTFSEGSADILAEPPMPQPLRVLRRRPGGDLRAVNNVGDLDHTILRRSRSLGSLTTYTDSIQSSFMRSPVQDSSGFVDVVSSNYSRDREEAFSLGAIAEQKPKRLSLFSTHSSKPVMRPSFEAEAQKLAQIPDDVDDDGGVESALLKLEGKFEKKSPRPSIVSSKSARDPARDSVSDAPANNAEKKEHRHQHVDEEAANPNSANHCEQPKSSHETQHTSHLSAPQSSSRLHEEERSFFAGSTGSYSSIPLLDRGLTDDGRSRAETREWTNHSILDDAPTPSATSDRDYQHSSFEFVTKSQSLENIHQPDEPAPLSPGTVSFLDDESDDGSDLSSEFSADLTDDEPVTSDRDGTITRSNTVASRLPAHPLGDPDPVPSISSSTMPVLPQGQVPSPPMTVYQPTQKLSETEKIPQLHEHQLWEEKPLPPTPDTAATTVSHSPSFGSPDPTGTREALRNAPKLLESSVAQKYSLHLPFIMAFDSDVLAQQFTLIEKDALNEIDWRDLIEMRWKNAENSDVRSWVDFLRNTDAHGVEVVIARFNIMVKWAISEVILTQDILERVRCVIKFINIAARCRTYRNFATMSQIAIALTSNEVSRLAKTWALVPSNYKETLRDLETLVTPSRNFYNLRAEMEAVGINSCDTGCIPFVGIYTHDLLFNAQRPSEIASSPTTVPLVNFERCRIAASVIKTLLRLLEASTLYDFQPIEGITERCLWMGALSDEEIRRHSQALE